MKYKDKITMHMIPLDIHPLFPPFEKGISTFEHLTIK
uniref:Uncharacterized protein n=1 Tax=Rhizophora mucronata TaxID=61149 RepID=A0A2P2JHQ9_RHIMU